MLVIIYFYGWAFVKLITDSAPCHSHSFRVFLAVPLQFEIITEITNRGMELEGQQGKLTCGRNSSSTKSEGFKRNFVSRLNSCLLDTIEPPSSGQCSRMLGMEVLCGCIISVCI